MLSWKSLGAAAVIAVACVAATPAKVDAAQVSIGVGIGAAPLCPYGYFDYAPYNCAPYGYYGPDWFADGIFIGAGPWYHGRPGWYGHVDNRWDPRHGYHGPFPDRGERPYYGFHGNEGRDGHGIVGNPGHDFHGEHEPGPGFRGGGGGHRR